MVTEGRTMLSSLKPNARREYIQSHGHGGIDVMRIYDYVEAQEAVGTAHMDRIDFQHCKRQTMLCL